MKRDTRNNYAIFWRGSFITEVRGYREALLERHAIVERQARGCSLRSRPCIVDTPSVSECCGCTEYCHATISKEVRRG